MNKYRVLQIDGWGRADTLLLSLLLLLAAVLRFWAYGRLGIDHFDEGGYAMSAMAVYEWRFDLLYPLQHLLSPPLFFSLAGLGMHLLGAPADQALFAVSSVAGSLSVGIMYLVGRTIHGREAGLVAGLLMALADYHIGFSRAGLTDVTFCLFFLLALVAYGRADRLESYRWAVLAGILTGLAWNTKYHGWLAGVIAGAALLQYILQGDWPRFRAGFARVFVAGLVAMLLYLPWALHVQGQEGGYAYLAEYQSGFLRPADYLQNIFSHVVAQYYLAGWSGMLAPLLGLAAVAALSRRLDGRIVMLGALLLLGGVGLGESIVVILLALAGLAVLLQGTPAYERSVVIAFFLVFTVLSPFYSPYTRLLLPLMCAAYILAGVGLAGLVHDRVPLIMRCPRRCQLLSMGVLSLALAVLVLATGNGARGHTYAERTGFVTAVDGLVSHIPEQGDVAVIGEPGVVFYLRTRGYRAVHLDALADLYDYFEPGATVYVVCGHYACFRKQDWFAQYPGAFTPVAAAPVSRMSEIRLFDDMSPWKAVHWKAGERGEYDLQLFRLVVPQRDDG